MNGDPRGHGGRLTIEALVGLAEVVVQKMEADRVVKVFDLLGESVKTGEPAHAQAHGEVLPLNVAGRPEGTVGHAGDNLCLGPNPLRRAVAVLTVRIRSVQRDELCLVNVAPERFVSSVEIGIVAVRG